MRLVPAQSDDGVGSERDGKIFRPVFHVSEHAAPCYHHQGTKEEVTDNHKKRCCDKQYRFNDKEHKQAVHAI